MTIKEVQKDRLYAFNCYMNRKKILKEISEHDFFDDWSCAYLSIGDNCGVEYNLCIDNTTNESINCSAIYKVDYDENNECFEIDYDNYIHYEIDFNKRTWKKDLENAMCDALIKLHELN